MYFSIASVSAILLAGLVNAAPMAGPGAGMKVREPEALPVPAMHHAAAPVEAVGKRAEEAAAAVEADTAVVETDTVEAEAVPETEAVADYRYQTNYRYSGI